MRNWGPEDGLGSTNLLFFFSTALKVKFYKKTRYQTRKSRNSNQCGFASGRINYRSMQSIYLSQNNPLLPKLQQYVSGRVRAFDSSWVLVDCLLLTPCPITSMVCLGSLEALGSPYIWSLNDNWQTARWPGNSSISSFFVDLKNK